MKRRLYERRRRNIKRALKAVILLGVVGLSIFGYSYFTSRKDNGSGNQNISDVITETVEKIVKKDFFSDTKLKEMEAIIAANPEYTVAVDIIDLKTEKTYHLGSLDPYTAASTTKVLSAVCLLKKVDAGTLKLTSPLGSSTVDYQLRQMINRSNNVSWDLINSKIGYTNLQTCARNLGVKSYKFNGNTVLPSEMAQMLASLSRYELLSKASTDLLLSYMQKTNEERMIPANTPTDYIVNHKYGIISGFLHDIGIVEGKDQKFAITIYTDGLGLGEAQLTARLSFYKELLTALYKEE